MQMVTEQNPRPFVDRRSPAAGTREGGAERRQFVATPSSRPEVAELAAAIDKYKLDRRRRFITYEELYDVMASLGYRRS